MVLLQDPPSLRSLGGGLLGGAALLLGPPRGLRRRALLLLAAPSLRERNRGGLRLPPRPLLRELREAEGLPDRILQGLPRSPRLARRVTFPLEGSAERPAFDFRPLGRVGPKAFVDPLLRVDLLLGARLLLDLRLLLDRAALLLEREPEGAARRVQVGLNLGVEVARLVRGLVDLAFEEAEMRAQEVRVVQRGLRARELDARVHLPVLEGLLLRAR